MADYKPPTEQLPIFDSSVFLTGDQALTQNQADKRYLRYPNAQGTENLQAINVNGTATFNALADFNTSVNVDGLTTLNNVLNMNGGSVGLSSIQTRELRLKDTLTGNNNSSKISTTTSVLTIDSVGPTATATTTEFTLRNSANTVITPLQLTTNINNMNVSLDMINTDVSYFSSLVRARYFNLRDLATSVLTNCGMYFSSNILQIDSISGTPGTTTNMYLRTTKADNSPTNALQLTNTTVKTDCYAITPLPANDNSNSIPTTTWVQNLIASPVIPPQMVKRAWAKRDNISSLVTGYSINFPDPGVFSTTWTINEMVSFRLTFNQEWNQVSGRNTIFNSSSCVLNIYPYRLSPAWLTQNIGTPTLGSLYTRGSISDNIISASSSTNNYVVNDTTYCPNGRQYFSFDLSNAQSGTTTGKLNISGDPSGLLTGMVMIWVVNPPGYNVASTPQNYNLSLELLNPSDLTANITASTGWDIGF